jgi:pyruvate,water dikinase
MPRGCTPIVQDLAATSIETGMRRVFAELGTPLDTLQMRFVNGQVYTRLRPLISPDKPPSRLPPKLLLKIATRVHPEMRRRNRTAGVALRSEPWVAVIDEWHAGGKAAIIAVNRRLQDTDLAALDDAGVLQHVLICRDHCVETWTHHFWLHGYDLGPIGQYLYEAQPWGFEASELLALLEGASPSTSVPTASLVRIRAVAEASRVSLNAITSLDDLRAASAELDSMIDEYLATHGAVLFSRYDLDGVTLGERPDLLLAGILNAEVHDSSYAVAGRTAAVRERVPVQRRARFDEILAQARSAMDLRDDNGPTTAEWPLGLMRLALLELGRRLVSADHLPRPELALELLPSELTPALFTGVPAAATLLGRQAERQAQKLMTPPATLGPEEPAPSPDVLPANLARLVGMVQTVVQHLGMDGVQASSGLHGVGVGTNVVRGRARAAMSPEEAFDSLQPGDILVVAGTTPAYNLVLSMAAGIVTADGGPMSHAAVIARELGLTAIVGARGALTDIPDGARIELDPKSGEVRILE